MASRRKTVNVEKVINAINHFNCISKNVSPDVRNGKNSVAAFILHEVGAYAGFGYLTADDVPAGEAPGVATERDADGNERKIFPDESRVMWYTSKLAK